MHHPVYKELNMLKKFEFARTKFWEADGLGIGVTLSSDKQDIIDFREFSKMTCYSLIFY